MTHPLDNQTETEQNTPTLIGVPYDGNSSFLSGAAEAPPLIRQALFSTATDLWTEEMVDLRQAGRLEDGGISLSSPARM